MKEVSNVEPLSGLSTVKISLSGDVEGTSMASGARFRFFLVGAQSLLIQCGLVLLEKGHSIVGVVSDDPAVARWAEEKDLKHVPLDADCVNLMRQSPFDLLLTIGDHSTLPSEALGLARKFSINQHDGLLPSYAGVNVTNWAIFNQEKTHGVTWHAVSADGLVGDVLKTRVFPISAWETALTLNAKCFEATVESFYELLDEIFDDRITPVKQDPRNRRYFGRWKRPQGNCAIDWNSSAEEIDALVRGLEFGHYENPLGLPKIYFGSKSAVLKEVEILESKTASAPGTILLADDYRLHVATAGQEVEVRGLQTFDGSPVSARELLEESGLSVGDRLPRLEGERREEVSRIHEELSRYEGFWANRLRNLVTLDVPFRNKRHESQPRQYLKKSLMLSERPFHRLGEMQRSGDVVLAALLLYFSRISGNSSFDIEFQDEALRQRVSNCEVFFASNVPLHAEVQFERGFAEYLAEVEKEVESVRSHGSYAKDLPLRDPILRNSLARRVERSTPLAIERVKQLSGREPDLSSDLVVVIPDEGNECVWWYDKCFDDPAIARMQEQFANLWDEVVRTAEDPEQKIGELNLLSPAERQRILVDWNDTKANYPCDKCVHQIFEEQVVKTPEAAAVVFAGESLSYFELNRRANQLAHYLREIGVKPDERVAICLERSFEMVVAMLAVLKAGGAYVPLDPAYPVERLRFMLHDSTPVALLTQHHLEALFSGIGDKLPVLDMTASPCAWQGQPEANPDAAGTRLNQRNLAYVNYTSGSTGQPKGVMVEHFGLRNLVLWYIEEFEFSSRDASLIVTSTSFDLTYKNIYAPLLIGGRIHLVKNLFDPQMILSQISGGDISFMNLTPTAYHSLMDADENHELSKMGRVFFGGEPIQPGKLLKIAKPRPEFVNTYGPTECTGITAFFRITSEIEEWVGRPVPIGRPLSNARVYILDTQGRLVPIGVTGEIHIGGAGVSRGYLNRPELTAEKFVPDPFVSEPGARMYRTGDLGRWLPDGTIEFMGRNDFQVKVRGFRIELGEIEARLSKHPGVREAVVVARADAAGEKCLVAYYTSAVEAGPINVEALRAHLFATLPEYMVPVAYVRLKSLPVTPSGKLDRRALPAPGADAFSTRDYEAPVSETEQKIATIWQDALGVAKVGMGHNFFDLGGDSLRLMRVQVRLRQEFKKDVAMVDMFRFTTVRALAQHLMGGTDSNSTDTVEIDRESRKHTTRRHRQLRRQVASELSEGASDEHA